MNISLEEKLIFLCSKVKVNPVQQKAIEDLLGYPLDWQKIINLSSYHEVMPLLYYNLNKLSSSRYIPEDIQHILKNAYFANLIRNISLYKELSFILDLLRKDDIKIIPFKGIVLAEVIYHNPALRMFADIDILVKEEDLAKIRTLFLNIDYKEVKQKQNFLFTKFIGQGTYSCLELDIILAPARPYKIQIPQVWNRTHEEIIFGSRVKCLSREDTFLSLALHIRRHTRRLPLKFICDIAELLNLYKDSLDWDYIQDLASKNHIKNSIYFCLYIVRELLDVIVSNDVMNRFNPGLFTRKLMSFSMNKQNFLKPEFWQGYILRLLLFDRFIDFFLYIYRIFSVKG